MTKGRAARVVAPPPAIALTLAVIAAGSVPTATHAQTTVLSPQVGWSEFRRLAVGVQLGHAVASAFEVAIEGVVFFPAEETDRPDVSLDRTAWQVNGNATYAFGPTRRVVPYAGMGASFARSGRTLVVDRVRARLSTNGWTPNVIVGVRIPQLPGSPFVEWRREIRRERQWMANAGLRLSL